MFRIYINNRSRQYPQQAYSLRRQHFFNLQISSKNIILEKIYLKKLSTYILKAEVSYISPCFPCWEYFLL
jgi:hypothetical protein